MITVLLPVLNEEDALPKLFKKLLSSLSDIPFRVVIVDDGSTDSSVDIINDWKDKISIELIRHDVNKGLGEAIKTGMTHCISDENRGGAIVTLDADDTHHPKYIRKMYEKFLNGCELIICSRYQDGSMERGVSAKRRVLSRAAGLLYQVCLPYRGIKDYTCGYRLYSTDLMKRYMEMYKEISFESKGFVIMSEILVKLRRLNPVAMEIPFVLEYDLKLGESKIRIGGSIIEHLQFIFRCLFNGGN